MLLLRRRLAVSVRQRTALLTVCFLILLLLLAFLHAKRSTDHRVSDVAVTELKVRVIPRIIHQTYLGRRIPQQYWDAVSSWRRHHPDYVYFLWTDADIDRFMETEYPDFVPLFRSYRHKLQRSDAARYFILFHYGGVYADMDVTALRPLDPLLSRFSCIISRERFEQTMYMWDRPQSLMNAVMASAPRHPFMRFVMLNLHTKRRSEAEMISANKRGSTFYIMASTGPLALTDLYERYPPCQHGSSTDCDVYLAPPEQLLPRLSPGMLNEPRNTCKKFSNLTFLMNKLSSKNNYLIQACAMLEESGYENSVPESAFTDHGFSHLGYRAPNNGWKYRDISELVANNWRQFSGKPTNMKSHSSHP